MRITEKEVVTRQILKDTLKTVTCNMCGDSTDIPQGSTQRSLNAQKHAEFSVSFGYGNVFKTERWDFDLCDRCLVSFLQTLKLAPGGFLESKSYPASEQALFEAWKEEAE